MKNKVITIASIWILVVLFLVVHAGYKYNTGGLSADSELSEIKEKVPETYYHFGGYVCFLNSAGNIVVINLNDDEIRTFDAMFCNPSNLRFGLIREGMTPYQVVSMVGIPIDLYNSGMSSVTTYITNSGDNPRIQWEYVFKENGDHVAQDVAVRNGVSSPIGKVSDAEQYLTANNRIFPMLQLVPWLHNLLDGAIVWAAILYTAKLRSQQKKKTTETE